ncbi:MAG: methyl-accepting chemotaxis protein [Acetivibrio sp.]
MRKIRGIKKDFGGKQRGKQKGKEKELPVYQRIQFKMILSFLLPVACIILLGITSYKKASEGIVRNYENSIGQTMNMMEKYLSLTCDTVQTNYKEYLNETELINYFTSLYHMDNIKNSTVYNSYFISFGKKVTADAMVSNLYFLSDKEDSIVTTQTKEKRLYTAFMKTKPGQIIGENAYAFYLLGPDAETDTLLNTPKDSYGIRLVRHFNNAKAIMVVDIKKSVVIETLASIDAGKESFVGFITCDGTELCLQKKDGEKPIFSESDFYKKAQKSEEPSGVSYVSYRGETYLFNYAKMGKRNAMICSLIPKKTILKQASDIKKLTFVIVIFTSILAIILGTALANMIGKNIKYMLHQLKKVEKGDFTVQVVNNQKNEFRLLAAGINQMVSHMKVLIADVTDVGDELFSAASNVSTSSETFISTAKVIQNSITEIEKGILLLDEDSEDCLQQMDELSGKIAIVTHSTTEIENLTDITKKAVTHGRNSMKELKAGSKATTQITGEVITSIEHLEEKSRSIEKIVGAINEIAEQTNLLSLNAYIEAARAGNSGRGFSVVAQEIRKLADESHHFAEEIKHIITEIAQNTKEVVSAAKEAENIVKSQENIVINSSDAFETVELQISALMQSLTIITQNALTMETAREKTLGAIESISAISEQTSVSSSNVQQTANSQKEATIVLENAAGKLEKRANELKKLLEKFEIQEDV